MDGVRLEQSINKKSRQTAAGGKEAIISMFRRISNQLESLIARNLGFPQFNEPTVQHGGRFDYFSVNSV